MASSSAVVPVTTEASKHNTDCVYFLASPLTCKKGNDCEFRHSENARVNPRDCWFWFSGNCLNEQCPFRHPPLDGLPATTPTTGGSTVATSATSANRPTPSSSSALTPSSTIRHKAAPCFFYSQGFCGKGIKCMFLHRSPSPFRKEATTYRKSQVSEQHEGNEPSVLKPKSEDVRALKPPFAVLHESYPIVNNTYRRPIVGTTNPMTSNKLSLSIVTGKEIQGTSRTNKIHSVLERTNNISDNRNSLSQACDESLQNVLPSIKGIGRGKLSRGLVQVLDRSCNNLGRTSEMQENVEESATQGVRELCAEDLRNRLEKRRRNDKTYSTLPDNLHSIDHSGDRLESGSHLARVESKDPTLAISKRVKQDKDESFTGPKSLAQIKAEKAKARTDGASKGDDMNDRMKGQKHCNFDSAIVSECMIEKKARDTKALLDSEIHHRGQTLANGNRKERVTTVISATEQEKTAAVDSTESHPFIADHSLPKTSEEIAGHLLYQSSSLYSSDHSASHTSHVQHNDEKRESIMEAHDVSVVNGIETCSTLSRLGDTSVDEMMKDGRKLADTEYLSDGEDEFARKLGGFLS